MSEQTLLRPSPLPEKPLAPAERHVAAFGTAAGFSALFAASACCVLPLGLAALGVGASVSSGIEALVPLHWPLTVAALLAVAGGWLLYFRRRRACSRNMSCITAAPSRQTLVLLIVATFFVTISSLWDSIEIPLMGLFS